MPLTVDAYRKQFQPASARPTRAQVIGDIQAGRLGGFERHGRWWVDDSEPYVDPEEQLIEAWSSGKKAQAR